MYIYISNASREGCIGWGRGEGEERNIASIERERFRRGQKRSWRDNAMIIYSSDINFFTRSTSCNPSCFVKLVTSTYFVRWRYRAKHDSSSFFFFILFTRSLTFDPSSFLFTKPKWVIKQVTRRGSRLAWIRAPVQPSRYDYVLRINLHVISTHPFECNSACNHIVLQFFHRSRYYGVRLFRPKLPSALNFFTVHNI